MTEPPRKRVFDPDGNTTTLSQKVLTPQKRARKYGIELFKLEPNQIWKQDYKASTIDRLAYKPTIHDLDPEVYKAILEANNFNLKALERQKQKTRNEGDIVRLATLTTKMHVYDPVEDECTSVVDAEIWNYLSLNQIKINWEPQTISDAERQQVHARRLQSHLTTPFVQRDDVLKQTKSVDILRRALELKNNEFEKKIANFDRFEKRVNKELQQKDKQLKERDVQARVDSEELKFLREENEKLRNELQSRKARTPIVKEENRSEQKPMTLNLQNALILAPTPTSSTFASAWSAFKPYQ